MAKNQKIWTEHEIEFVKNSFINMTCEEMGTILNRTTRSVQQKYGQLGLVRPKPNIGDKIGRLKILEYITEIYNNQNRTMAKCQCECGKIITTRLTSIIQGKSLSCGCLKNDKSRERAKTLTLTHGETDTRLYRIWAAMKTRCYNSKTREFHWYGAKGIKICDEWINSFETFRDWSLKNGYREDLSIDRKENDKDYCPENCRWETKQVQALNRTSTRKTKIFLTAFNETKSMYEWEQDSRCVVDAKCMFHRIGSGWTHEEVITTPSERA